MVRTRVGYAGGTKDYPTYRDLGDHAESLQVDYDPAVVSFADLLAAFWDSHLPNRPTWTRQYASILYYHDDAQQQAAQASLEELARRRGTLYTEVLPAGRFWMAEDYHQKYYLRGTPELQREYAAIYPSPADFTASTATARVNGYLGGHGSSTRLAKEIDDLGLTPKGQDFLTRLVARKAF